MNYLRKLNQHYDQIAEPFRFGLTIASIGLILAINTLINTILSTTITVMLFLAIIFLRVYFKIEVEK